MNESKSFTELLHLTLYMLVFENLNQFGRRLMHKKLSRS
jgi:hypothetical protein